MPIQILPPQLANQIAAGEVVERPASVVKELAENSLDAGATRIDIDIEKGGSRLIRIRDNGAGICKEELTMALARHATSKIATLDDLDTILSLGFRGEALASISSVSRLTLTSRTATQDEAWQAYAEGRDMMVTVKPAAHPTGTTLEVRDLFYNTPARRKFMRTEKTEFSHIDEVVMRIALARFDIAISLTHNGKLIRQYRGATDDHQRRRRLGAVCGTTFMTHALAIEWQHGDLSLHGWVADPAGSRQVAELQYCYVNGRIMRDRLINHAIRQAYQQTLGSDQQPAYVLYLDLPPDQVDVNVHPAKHEVRFHQSRLVHDFIYQGVLTVLQEASTLAVSESDAGTEPVSVNNKTENRLAAGSNQFSVPAANSSAEQTGLPLREGNKDRSPAAWSEAGYQKREGKLYQQLLQQPYSPRPDRMVRATVPACEPTEARFVSSADEPLPAGTYSFGRVLTVLKGGLAVLEQGDGLVLIALAVAYRWLTQAQLMPGPEGLKPQPLLIPIRLKVEAAEREALARFTAVLGQFGLTLQADGQYITLYAVPLPLRQQNLQILISDLLGYLAQQQALSPEQVAQWLVSHIATDQKEWNHSQAIALLAEVERLCPALVQSPPSGLLQPINIEMAVNALKHE